MRVLGILLILALFATSYAAAQVVFSDDFESYRGQQQFEQYDNPSDPFDPIWLTLGVWHGQIAPPNLQLINIVNPYTHPAYTGDPYLPQPSDAKAHSGQQSLWLKAGAHRANFLNLSAPLGTGAYVDWWFYDTGSAGKQANAWVELLYYTNGLLDVGAGVTTGQVESFSLGAASFDPKANRNAYQVRGDISDPAYYPSDSFASQGGGAATWANFSGTTRSAGWHHAAIWLWKPNEVLFILDGATKIEPRNPAYGATTVRIRGLASNATDFYFDDVTVGAGIPPAMPRSNTACAVTLTDFTGDYSLVSLQIEIRQPNDLQPLEVQQVSPDTSGSVQVALPVGRWDLAFKADRSLRRVLRSVNVPASGTLNVSLLGGDADGDNEVSLFDFGKLVAAFGTLYGDPGYDPATDFDGDGEISLFDFGILVRNFGLVGDE
ncbi:hypothetical protein HRbin16_02399 [bacterium HR16]|nr:hypothetical protein HRbin16_02399 [bacterium HR16]